MKMGKHKLGQKAENSIVEDGKTFEVYTNSGDESLKVKVDQQISDGLQTNPRKWDFESHLFLYFQR